MKKLISILLAVSVMLSMPVFFASATQSKLSFLVVNDIHQNKGEYNRGFIQRNNDDPDYAHVFSSGKLVVESTIIFDAFLREAADSDADFILIPGDFTDSGERSEVISVCGRLKDFEARTGKRIFVIDGNHDMGNTAYDTFKSDFAEFGYDEAIAVDPNSCSYVAELNGEYRLIAIDTCKEYFDKGYFDAERIQWLTQQLDLAAADGKKVITISHHNILPHIRHGEKLYKRGMVDVEFGLADLLADAGVQLNFCGHVHFHDIAEYTSEKGNRLYDVVTGSLIIAPCNYRTVSVTDKGTKISTKHITSIESERLPAGLSQQARLDAETDFQKYVERTFEVGMIPFILDQVNDNMLAGLLGVTEDDPSYDKLVDASKKLRTALKIPLYDSLAQDGETSIEQIVNTYGVALYPSEFTTPLDIIIEFYKGIVYGDENYTADSDECVIAYRTSAACISYTLSDFSDQDYVNIISAAATKFGIEKYLPVSVREILAGAITRYDGIELVMTYSLSAIVEQFTVDASPSDNNVNLVIYGADSPTRPTTVPDVYNKVMGFFIKLFNLLLVFFGIK